MFCGKVLDEYQGEPEVLRELCEKALNRVKAPRRGADTYNGVNGF
jgi:hypothetical protein